MNNKKEVREKHINSEVRPYKYPLLWIRDKSNDNEHLYGTDSHDSLYIDQNGNLQYHNLQSGRGTGECGSYEFISHDDDGYGYGDILHLFVKENKIG